MDIEPKDLFNTLAPSDSTEKRILKNEEGLGSPMVPTVPNENGFAPEFNGLLGVKTFEPRVSLLQHFDPLYENSPIKERLLIDDRIIDDNEEVILKDAEHTLSVSRHATSTEKLLDISVYDTPNSINQVNQTETEVFNTPLTSPQKHLGSTTQESFCEGTLLQQSSDRTSVSPGRHSLNSLAEGTDSLLTNSISVPSIQNSTSTLSSPTSDYTGSLSNSDLISSDDIESKPKSTSVSVPEKPADSLGIPLDNTSIPSDQKSEEHKKQLLDIDDQEFFDSHSTSLSIDLPPNEVQIDIHTTSLISSDSAQLEPVNLQTPSTGNECLPDVEEDSCQKNGTSGIECLSVSKESRRRSGSPSECDSEIKSSSVIGNLTFTEQPIPTSDIALSSDGKEVEIHCDVSVSNKTAITESSIDGFPIKESVVVSALPVSCSDTEALKSKSTLSIDSPPNEVQIDIHTTSLISSDSAQLEPVNLQTPSTGNGCLPDVEEDSCQKNGTSGIECLSVSKESRRRSGSPSECDSEIKSSSVIGNLTFTEQPIPTSDIALSSDGKEVEIHCDVSVSNKTVITESSIDGFPIKESVVVSAPPVSCSDTEALKSKMADLSEDLAKHQQENSELRLQLNALQQARASLELEVRQKEEIIIKSQAEALKIEQKYKQEIKTLKEKVKENSTLIEKGDAHHLQDQLKEAQLREAKLTADLQARIKLEEQYAKIMEEYERTLQHQFDEHKKLKEKYEINKTHLANLELAFSDVHSKYEKSKESLQTLLLNEEALIVNLDLAQATNNQHEERYESLRQHAGNQIDKSNKEILAQRERYESEVLKLKAIIKRLEIKCSSLEISLQQKVEECEQLAALCDEVTGKKI